MARIYTDGGKGISTAKYAKYAKRGLRPEDGMETSDEKKEWIFDAWNEATEL